jgi:hypothetical protein
MPFVVIKGTYHVRGYAPDGDSIRFHADNELHWARLSGPPVRLNGRRHAQLRFEAIDTLETHFLNTHQPRVLAVKALDFLLHELMITGVQWDVLFTRVTAANDGVEGYVLARAVEKHGRPVVFAYAGAAPEPDGASLFLDAARLRASINYRSLEFGLAYPTYYRGLFYDLRAAATEAVRTARAARMEIWADDRTTSGFVVDGLEAIQERHVILPKLFRRLAEYLDGGGVVAGFKQYLEARGDLVTILPTAHFTHFDTVVEVSGETVRLTVPPEDLIFEE